MGRRNDDLSSIDVQVGLRINLRRGFLGYSPLYVANCLGVSLDVINAFESGFARPTGAQVIDLCRALEIEPSWLFSGDSTEGLD
jgi:transcriptional regulator with XRE-family HTH domain